MNRTLFAALPIAWAMAGTSASAQEPAPTEPAATEQAGDDAAGMDAEAADAPVEEVATSEDGGESPGCDDPNCGDPGCEGHHGDGGESPGCDHGHGPPLVANVHLFSRFETRDGYDELALPNFENQDIVRYRARLGLKFAPVELLEGLAAVVRLVPQSSGLWQAGGDTLEDAGIGLHEGVLELHSCLMRLEAGRFEMNYGDQLVVGSVGWHQTGRAFDGFRLHLTPDPNSYWVDAFFTQLAEGLVDLPEVARSADGDRYFWGLYAGLGPLLKEGFDLDAYVLGQLWPRTTTFDATGGVTGARDAASEFTVGTRVKHKAGDLDYRLEAGLQFGSRPTHDNAVFAYQADLEIGYTLLDGELRTGLEGFIASGDRPHSADRDEGWNQLFPTAHKWLGFADVIPARNNIGGGALHLSYSPAPWRFSVDGHYFVRMKDVGTIERGPAGIEFDLGAERAIGSGLTARTNYSIFLPNEDRFPASDSPAHFFELELAFKH